MKVRETFCNIKCDCCGQPMDDENYYPENELPTIAAECNFKHLGGRDYCPDCWTYDDDDNIVCGDGRKYNGNTHEPVIESNKQNNNEL